MESELSIAEEEVTSAEEEVEDQENSERTWMIVAALSLLMALGCLAGCLWVCLRGRPRLVARVVSVIC